MANKRRKNPTPPRLEKKYAVRRFFIVLSLIALTATAFVYAGYSMAQSGRVEVSGLESEASSESSSTGAIVEPKPTAKPEPVYKAPESESEPEPEPPVKFDPDDWKLLLVNKENPLPDDFDVELEVVVGEFRVDTRIKEPLLRMIAEAREDGIVLLVCSAYRDVEYQSKLFDNQVNQRVNAGMSHEQAVAAAAMVVTNPGTSEHHTGLAVDIVTPDYQNLDEGFTSTPAFKWLSENAASYGFIMRYPKDKEDITDIIYESWHYRYVGPEAAAEINEKGLCLEEYIELLKNPPATTEDDIDEDET